MKCATIKIAAISTLLLLAMSSLQANDTSVDDKFTANLSGYLGHKSMDDDDWSTLDDQAAFGVIFDVKKQNWPVSLVYGLVGTGDIDKNGSLKSEAYTVESRIGVRKTFHTKNSPIYRYINGGVAKVYADIKNKNAGVITSEDDDSATGAWIGAGLNYAVNEHFIIGFDVTYTDADVTLLDTDRKAGGVNSGITAGYHW